jgi:xylulokinase
MNVTVATEMVRADFKMTHEQFADEAAKAPAGSEGLMLLPYLEGERTPNVPNGTGVWFGANQKTFTAAHFARAAMEGVTLGMNYGLRRLRQLSVDAEVVTVQVSEGAAYGAALQALWCWRLHRGERLKISDITGQFVHLNKSETAHPQKAGVSLYRDLQGMQDELSLALRAVFQRHHKFVSARGGKK